MKKLLLLIVLVVVILGAGFATANHYQNYQNKQQAEAQTRARAEAEALVKERMAADAETASLVAQVNTLRAECQKGIAAYDALPLFTQATLQKPACL